MEPTKIATGTYHTCALFPNGKIKCWGNNEVGQLGLGDTYRRGDEPGEMGQNLPFLDLHPTLKAIDISASEFHTCAVFSNGQVKCWGGNEYGQLGLDDTLNRGDKPGDMANLPFVNLGSGSMATSISTGYVHTCAVFSNGQVKCWGNNTGGRLGLGDTTTRGDKPGDMATLPFVNLGPGLTVTQVEAGGSHTCARFSNGSVKCWGYNGNGKLGIGDFEDRGDDSNEMGTSLPVVQLGTGLTATSIETGASHTCALLSDASVKCWGDNTYGQLGVGNTISRGGLSSDMGNNLQRVLLGSGLTVSSMSSGVWHTCAVFTTGRVKCWGYNVSGQLGLGDLYIRGDQVAEMGTNLKFVDISLNGFAPVSSIRAGGYHSCAVLADGSAKCWGRNGGGQLGLFDTLWRGDEANEMGESLPFIDF